jgi:PAT family beta-lactamase induction signal transducer AmpG
MIDITNKSYWKYILFASLYFSEGLKWAISVVILPIYFDDLGISPTIIGLAIAIIGIPVMIKFIFGGIVDYFIKFGRKRFIMIGGLTASISLIIAGFINPANTILPFILILFIGLTGIAFLDVAADAWAIETTKQNERGRVNGAMFTGLFVGMSVGSFLFSQIAENFGYNSVFFVAGAMTLLITIFPLAIKEMKKVIKRKKISKVLLKEFKKKNVQIFSIFTPVAVISGGLLLIVVPLYMKNVLMLNIAQIGLIAAIFPITNIFGSIIGGVLSDKIGRKFTIYIVFSLSIIFSGMLIFASTWQILAVLYAIVGFLFGAIYATVGALAMDVTNPRIAATQFSIFMALLNVGEVGIGNGLAGVLLDNLGYRRVFLYSGLIYGIALLIIYTLKIKRNKKKNT